MTPELAKVLLAMTWDQMDDFAMMIRELSIANRSEANDLRCIAVGLISSAKDEIDE